MRRVYLLMSRPGVRERKEQVNEWENSDWLD